MRCHDIIVAGASADGVQTLPELIGDLPADLPVPVLVVQHTAATGVGRAANMIGKNLIKVR